MCHLRQAGGRVSCRRKALLVIPGITCCTRATQQRSAAAAPKRRPRCAHRLTTPCPSCLSVKNLRCRRWLRQWQRRQGRRLWLCRRRRASVSRYCTARRAEGRGGARGLLAARAHAIQVHCSRHISSLWDYTYTSTSAFVGLYTHISIVYTHTYSRAARTAVRAPRIDHKCFLYNIYIYI